MHFLERSVSIIFFCKKKCLFYILMSVMSVLRELECFVVKHMRYSLAVCLVFSDRNLRKANWTNFGGNTAD